MKLLFSTMTLVLSLVFNSCSNQSNHQYYLLSPAGPASSAQGKRVGIGPVTTADYLNRSYLVFQTSANTLDVNENHEWAGDLNAEVARVLGTNIGRRINSGAIESYPWDRESNLDYQVIVDIKRFHGTNTGEALLEASWKIYRLPGGRRITSRSTTLTEKLSDDGFSSLAAAQSLLIDKLSAEISQSL